MATSEWQPHREPWGSALLRTALMSLAIGAAIARLRGGMARWAWSALVAFWPVFGGHCLEVWFLNWLRPRLPATRGVQIAIRLAVWWAGGVAIGAGMWGTAWLGGLPIRWLNWRTEWWWTGFGFVGIELAAHFGLWVSRLPNFYNGRG